MVFLIFNCLNVFLWFFFFETEGATGRRILPSLFQSVTLRTAGFNTVDLTRISGGGQTLMILGMLIGGSPGSTAGGMKTTTAAVLLLTAWSVFRRKEDTAVFGRRIGEEAGSWEQTDQRSRQISGIVTRAKRFEMKETFAAMSMFP